MPRWFPALALAAVVVACSDQPMAPEPGTTAFSATSDWTRSTMFISNLLYVDCLEEEVLFSGNVETSMHEVVSASGVYSYHFRFLATTPRSPQFTGVGQTSGQVYWYDNGLPFNESYRLGPGEVLTFKGTEHYLAENGDKLFGDYQVHFTVNANGELTVDRAYNTGVRCEK